MSYYYLDFTSKAPPPSKFNSSLSSQPIKYYVGPFGLLPMHQRRCHTWESSGMMSDFRFLLLAGVVQIYHFSSLTVRAAIYYYNKLMIEYLNHIFCNMNQEDSAQLVPSLFSQLFHPSLNPGKSVWRIWRPWASGGECSPSPGPVGPLRLPMR